MSKPIDRDLLAKYTRGGCSAEEEEMVHQWLDQNDSDKYPDIHGDKKNGRKKRVGWKRLTGQIEELNMAGGIGSRWYRRRGWAIAASVAILVGLSAFFYHPLLSAWRYKVKYETGYGEIKRISLEDGTTVMLNAKSVLAVSKNYNRHGRIVYLSGEAYFKVKKKSGQPFEVRASGLSVTALGTAFDVSAFPESEDMSVWLKEGSVLVKSGEQTTKEDILLSPGEGVTYRKDGNLIKKGKFDAKINFAWQHQIISFEDADMQEVVAKLERFYGVKIITDKLAPRHWHLTGEYQNQTLRDVLESLSFNYNLKYKMQHDEVILYEP